MASLVVAGDVSGSVTLSAPSAAGSTVITLPTTSGTMVVTGGAQTVQFAAGSAASPSITFTGDTNTGIFSPAADTIAFSEGGVESMRIDSSGNLNMSTVGGKVNFATTSSATVNYIGVPADGFSLELACQRGASQPFVYKQDFANGHIWSSSGTERMRIDTSGNVGIGVTDPASFSSRLCVNGGRLTMAGGNRIGFWDSANLGRAEINSPSYQALAFYRNDGLTESMRIDSSGNAYIGKTSASTSTAGYEFNVGGSAYSVMTNTRTDGLGDLFILNRQGSNGTLINFFTANSSRGTISYNGSVIVYGGSSDYRLKENIQPMTGALAKVAQLKPVTYTWKSNGKNGEGFIAHELQEVVPDCVAGEKDAVDAEGNPQYQNVDPRFLVATLTAAIQELNAKVEAQAAEIAALKGAN